MLNRRTLLKSSVAFATAMASTSVTMASEGPLKVVATFSVLGDMVSRIGGEHVSVTTLVGPDGDAHVYQPVPADAKALRDASVLVVNGLGFEGWLDRLVDASGFQGVRVAGTDGITPLAFGEDAHHDDEKHDDHGDDADHKDDDHAEHHDDDHKDGDHAGHKDGEEHADHDHHDHGAFDPHGWHSVTNAVIYVDNITAALSKADPTNASTYFENRAAYVAEIEAMDAEIRTAVATLPLGARTVVTQHDAFGYFADAYGLTFVAPQGLSTESEASAADVAKLIRQIRAENIKAVFVENVADSRLLEQISNETGAVIGGALYSDALSAPDGPAGTYLDMMRHNTMTLVGALAS